MSNIFDGIERPLSEIYKQSGDFIRRGLDIPSIDFEREWEVTLTVQVGDTLRCV